MTKEIEGLPQGEAPIQSYASGRCKYKSEEGD